MVIALRTVRSEIPLDSRRRSLPRRSSELIITALGACTFKGGELGACTFKGGEK